MSIIKDRPTNELPRETILIGGKWRETGSSGKLEHIDPTLGEVQADFANGGAKEIDEAVAAAKAAYPAWRKVGFAERRSLMLKLADLIEQNADRFTRIAALEA